ncbi:MAG TPA: rhodanese-like domain-containing protein [Bryobacteraceae bacterium]|nr:rhodanese-like domain-containing protein [Bryobacteraceae bacterium]
MYFQQFYLTCLSHASYMLGSEGVACVVDPQRDVSLYLDEARAQGLKIEHIIETHLHADFVSGHVELAAKTGAKIYLGAAADSLLQHVAVRDGDEIRFGRVILKFLETPGHTVESVSVVVTDLDRGEKPWAVLTGDTLFIGDVGRPDLSGDKTPQELAGMLYDSLHQKLEPLGDDVEVYPAHGAGSLCGKQMRPERQSTIGKERALNYALRAASKEEFVRLLTAELPDRPEYFAQDAEINRTGAIPLEFLLEMEPFTPAQLLDRQRAGDVILDTRPAMEFGSGHVPGSVNIPLAGQFAGTAGALLGLDHDIIVIAEDQAAVEESRTRLARVGFERVAGYLDGGMPRWVADQMPTAQTMQITAAELKRELDEEPGSIQLVDVRRKPEWDQGHIAGALHKPLDRVAKLLDDLDRTKPVVVHCKGGYRSAIACSLIQRAGFENVANLIGGLDAWQATGLAVSA